MRPDAVTALAFWTYPSGAAVLVITLLVLAGLVVIELVSWTREPETSGA